MAILKAIFGDWGQVFAPDFHTDAYKQYRLALWRFKHAWGQLMESLGKAPS